MARRTTPRGARSRRRAAWTEPDRSQRADHLERLAVVETGGRADAGELVDDAGPEPSLLFGRRVAVVDVHRGLELALVLEQRRDLGVGEPADVLDVVGLVR